MQLNSTAYALYRQLFKAAGGAKGIDLSTNTYGGAVQLLVFGTVEDLGSSLVSQGPELTYLQLQRLTHYHIGVRYYAIHSTHLLS